jgi:hypothetical protein
MTHPTFVTRRHRPPALLARGRERSGGKAKRMSPDEFVRRAGERERASYDDALEHARAVVATLREALPDKELSDLLAQLPRGYREAPARARGRRLRRAPLLRRLRLLLAGRVGHQRLEHLARQPGAVGGVLRRGGDPHDDLVGIDLLEHDVR